MRLTSISPYWVSVSVRGIGVAVMTSRGGGCSALDAGRSEQRCLGTRFDRGEHRQQRHKRLPRADIALEQAEHRRGLRHVAPNFLDHAPLRAGELVRQLKLGG